MKYIMHQELCIKDESGRVVALCVGMSKDEEEAMLKEHPKWYRSSIDVPK